jgi:hypothetical protein
MTCFQALQRGGVRRDGSGRQSGELRGRAVQADPTTPTLKAPGLNPLKL